MALYGFELETLLAPFDGNPAGSDMRAEPGFLALHDAVLDARNAEIALQKGSEHSSRPDWDRVVALAAPLLAESAKDIEAAAWMTEALVRTDGLSGLAFGAKLLAGLIENFWEILFPLPDEEGLGGRMLPIMRLTGTGPDGRGSTLAAPLLKLMLFRGPDGQAVSVYDYEKSAAARAITDQKELQLRIGPGLIPYDKLQQAARGNAADLAGVHAGLLQAEAGWRNLGTQLEKAAGGEAPSTRFIGELLGRIGAVIKRYAPASAEIPEPLTPAEGGQQPGAGPADVQIAATRLVTREDALAKLAEIADYFRRTEPQSPLAYTIDEAIRRGRMTWPELLQEVVSDQQLRNTILNSLGNKLG